MSIPTVPTLNIDVTFQEPNTLKDNTVELVLRTPVANLSPEQLALIGDVNLKHGEVVQVLSDVNAVKADIDIIKADIDAKAIAVTNGMFIAGNYDASGGVFPATPTEGSALYRITVGGTISSVNYAVGDLLVYDNANDVWFKFNNTAAVTSVAGRQGAVTLTPTDIIGLGTAATKSTNDFATAAQGDLANSAVQPSDLGSAASYDIPLTGNASSGQVVVGNDTRLTNAREWTASTVSVAEALDETFTGRRAWTSQRVHQVVNTLIGGSSAPVATTGSQGLMSAADKTKLDSIAANATVNSTDASLRDRSTHTGTQAITTITGLSTQLADLATDINTVDSLLDTKLSISQRGVINGVASLDGSGKIPIAQIPDIATSLHDHNTLYYSKAECDSRYLPLGGDSGVVTTANNALTTAQQAQADADAALEVAASVHGFNWVVMTSVASALSVENRDGVFTDTSNQQQTINLPADPVLGDTIAISDGVGNWENLPCVVNRNGQKIMGLNQNIILNVSNQTVYLTFADSAKGWRLT